MPLKSDERQKITQLLIERQKFEDYKKLQASGHDRALTDTERTSLPELLKTQAELKAIQKRVNEGKETFTNAQKDSLNTALSFVTSVINEKNMQAKPKNAGQLVSDARKKFLESKSVVESTLSGKPKAPEKASVVPVSGLPSYEQATAKPAPATGKLGDWRDNALKVLKGREKLFKEHFRNLQEKGITDESGGLNRAMENLHALEKIFKSPPRFRAESTFKSMVQQFDKNIVAMLNATGLERTPEGKPELSRTESSEPKTPVKKTASKKDVPEDDEPKPRTRRGM